MSTSSVYSNNRDKMLIRKNDQRNKLFQIILNPMGWNIHQVVEFYDNYAHQYDNDTPESQYPSASLLNGWVVEHLLALERPVKVLDVGCGTGKSSAAFFDSNLDCKVIGVDASATVEDIYPDVRVR
jgi:cyclopropane fatty-acyl-phospholipid synthase-like methyltransferase